MSFDPLSRCLDCIPNRSSEEMEIILRSRKIDKVLKCEGNVMKRQVMLLLLGAGESGKSTFLKQMRIIHNIEFDETSQCEFTRFIYQNIVKGMKVLVDAQTKLRIPLSDPENEILGKQLLLLEGTSNLTNTTFGELQLMLKSLWADDGIQTAFNRRNEFQLSDSVQYFLDNLDRISAEDYRPTLQDVLLCRKTTKGVIEFRIEIDKVPFLFVDVGGQRTQRQKWFQCFESVTSILFMASISEFDQVLLEDGKTNRLKESRFIFDTIVNNKIFENISMILFLNKLDLLKEKVARSNIGEYFEEFNDIKRIQELCKDFKGNWKDLEDVKKFVLFYFLSAKQKTTRSLYHHFTVAINTNNIRIVFQDVKHSILKKNLDMLLLQ